MGPSNLKLATRENLDKHTKACHHFMAIANAIANEFGGWDRLTTIDQELILAFVGADGHVTDLTAKRLAGQDVNIAEHCRAITAMVRTASRLPRHRHMEDITSVSDLIQEERSRAARAPASFE